MSATHGFKFEAPDGIVDMEVESLIAADKDKPIPQEELKEALRLAMHKLPIKCKIVAKADQDGGAQA